jgi:hypothetical protein
MDIPLPEVVRIWRALYHSCGDAGNILQSIYRQSHLQTSCSIKRLPVWLRQKHNMVSVIIHATQPDFLWRP